MEDNNYNNTTSKQTIICPIVTVWIVFAFNALFVFAFLALFPLFVLGKQSLTSIGCLLIVALFVTGGIKRKDYCNYKTGLMISLIFSIVISIYLFIFILAITLSNGK